MSGIAKDAKRRLARRVVYDLDGAKKEAVMRVPVAADAVEFLRDVDELTKAQKEGKDLQTAASNIESANEFVGKWLPRLTDPDMSAEDAVSLVMLTGAASSPLSEALYAMAEPTVTGAGDGLEVLPFS